MRQRSSYFLLERDRELGSRRGHTMIFYMAYKLHVIKHKLNGSSKDFWTTMGVVVMVVMVMLMIMVIIKMTVILYHL